MKIEKIVQEKEKVFECKEFKMQTSQPNQTIEVSEERLIAAIYYWANPSSKTQTSIISLQNLLRNYKAFHGPLYNSKLSSLLSSLPLTNTASSKILSGELLSSKNFDLFPPNNITEAINYLYKNLDHPESLNKTQELLKNINLGQLLSEISNKDSELAFKLVTLAYSLSRNDFLDVFIRFLDEKIKGKSIEEIFEFLETNDEMLRVAPDGKMLHSVYMKLAGIISGNKGAKVLAEYMHRSIIKEKNMKYLVELYMLCEQKDAFEKFYSELCIERLLKGSKIAIEQGVCSKIQASVGPDSMYSTALLLKNTMEHNFLCPKMNVIVTNAKIVSLFSPFSQIIIDYIPKELPQSFSLLLENYSAGFKERFPNKKIKILYLNSMIEMIYGGCDIICNFLQALILIKFNDKSSITEDELLQCISTEILTPSQVKTELASLSIILKKTDNVYTLSSIQSKFLDLITKSQASTEDTFESMEDIRKPIIDCFIVKLLKQKKQIDEAFLFEELHKSLKFSPEKTTVMERLNNLISRGFLWQVEQTYGYIP
ncbi:hypothetical protein SteCoe_28261 [Stentor coeruleus]|uniref:Cullin family profile domain-containing protein n=1 Tax=Stentor coeruleus TaxID=5963 RepID=A0A1R2B8M8_9CILI|nr:hypothetical protein SteCoe_28261 [Stentor coeruleus]